MDDLGRRLVISGVCSAAVTPRGLLVRVVWILGAGCTATLRLATTRGRFLVAAGAWRRHGCVVSGVVVEVATSVVVSVEARLVVAAAQRRIRHGGRDKVSCVIALSVCTICEDSVARGGTRRGRWHYMRAFERARGMGEDDDASHCQGQRSGKVGQGITPIGRIRSLDWSSGNSGFSCIVSAKGGTAAGLQKSLNGQIDRGAGPCQQAFWSRRSLWALLARIEGPLRRLHRYRP